jgi:arginine decarboxylase
MWNIDSARTTYSLAHWGNGYFDVADNGHLLVRPTKDESHSGIDLYALANELGNSGLSLPVLVRFTDILHHRVQRLNEAFQEVMQRHRYGGKYTAVYPIKVNQQESVVRELLGGKPAGKQQIGLEAGSKPELMAVLALNDPQQGTIICNGYKDREYIRLALMGKQLGHNITIVLEKPSELELVIEESRKLGIQPRLGVRVRLASMGSGNWQNTGGEKSKFGLSASQVLQMAERLHREGMQDTLSLLHCHMGSQLANIRDIQRGLRECGRYFAELHHMGFNIRCVDVGGGLGIDYEGTRSRSICSANYSLHEYARNVVHTLWEICAEFELPHPDIITESGRAMTAHHAVLITNVVEVESSAPESSPAAPGEDEPQVIHDLWRSLNQLQSGNGGTLLETYHEAVHGLADAQAMYVHGVLSLAQKARAEELYFAICHGVRERLDPSKRAHREILDELNEKLADKYFCNFSLFQSLPDVWAIEQIFPIVPLHRLDEAPSQRGVLQDITCDSDGRIDHYVDNEGIESSLPLHRLRKGGPYLLGIFLTGAYQEILGDMHNLFGDTNAVNVSLQDDGSYRLEQHQQGDTVDEVLRYVHFEPETLLTAYQAQIAQASLTAGQAEAFLAELSAGLDGYTYLEE